MSGVLRRFPASKNYAAGKSFYSSYLLKCVLINGFDELRRIITRGSRGVLTIGQKGLQPQAHKLR